MPSRKKSSVKLSPERLRKEILQLFRAQKKPLLLREIYHFLSISSSEKPVVRKVVKELVEEGELIHVRKRRYALPEEASVVKGKLRTHPEGFGFVETEDGRTVFIPPRKMGKALDGDIVLVKVERVAPKGPEGKILKVLERKRKNIVGYLFKRKKFYFLEPEDPRFPFELYIPKKRRHGAKPEHLVVSKIV